MTGIELSPRERTILNCVVESYVRSATPIGSSYLTKTYSLGISPATIRNTMNDLEEKGYLTQPHTSAGRMPTDMGYRCYVDGLRIPRLRKVDREVISETVNPNYKDEEDILESSSQALSRISNQLGIVLEPRFDKGIFQKMELVSVSDKKLLAVITIKSGLVKTVMLEVDAAVNEKLLSDTSWLINYRLCNLTLEEIVRTIETRFADDGFKENHLLQTIIRMSNKLFNFKEHENLYFGGINQIMLNPEFTDRERALKILRLLESKEIVLHYFEDIDVDTVSVRIGMENRQDVFQEYSVVSAKYHIGSVSGTLGVVGPTRMQYAKIIALVDYMRTFLSQALAGVSSS